MSSFPFLVMNLCIRSDSFPRCKETNHGILDWKAPSNMPLPLDLCPNALTLLVPPITLLPLRLPPVFALPPRLKPLVEKNNDCRAGLL